MAKILDGLTEGEGDAEEREAIMEYDGEVDLAAEIPDFLRRHLETRQ